MPLVVAHGPGSKPALAKQVGPVALHQQIDRTIHGRRDRLRRHAQRTPNARPTHADTPAAASTGATI